MIRVEHSCLDGSPFPVTFARAVDVDSSWVIDREHAPEAMTPLADAVRRQGRAGEERAYAECGVTMPSMLLRDRPVANGYAYHLDVDVPPEEWEVLGRELLDLARGHGGSSGVWAERCLPAVQASCTWLQDAAPDTPFAVLAERREHAWGLTSVAGLVARVDERAVAASCEPAFGDRAGAVAFELACGSANETVAADRALERIARLAPGSAAFAAARTDFLVTYGSRSVSWSIDHPTLAERPDLVDAQIQLLRRHGRGASDGIEAAAAERRRVLATQVEAALASEDDRAAFRRRLGRLAAFVPVREARARWQLVASGAVRGVVQQRGRALAAAGVLAHADDVFYLEPHEYDAPSGDLRDSVAARQLDHQHWLAITPPPVIGATTSATAPLDADAGGGAGPGPGPVLVQGVPGSGGVAAGPARVIRDLADVDRFEPGDVLVTTMTSPAWTPLFGLAAAVVTDAGDALSHVAIAAREYAIPCVAGTDHATVTIPDGARLIVDGDAGTVTIAAVER